MTTNLCTFCGGLLAYLGQLGNLWHFRCLDCGLETSCEAQPEEVPEIGGEG